MTVIFYLYIYQKGGRYIENELKKLTTQTLISGGRNNLLPPPFKWIPLQHQFYTTIYKYRDIYNVNFNNIKVFSVVRNPYDRIISDLFFWRLINKNDSSEYVSNIIEKHIKKNKENHTAPQYLFLSDENENLIDNIKIFKTETLNQDNNILNKYLGFNIPINTDKNTILNKDYSKYLNDNSISIINKYYEKDFYLFNYDMK